ncbi:MAG: hypothetical protein IKT38_04445 [Clostridia bacterium]|nr:hypothetical protein [Clostridia bacterium]
MGKIENITEKATTNVLYNNKKGLLSRADIIDELTNSDKLKINLGINDEEIVTQSIQSASYDLTPTIIAMSSKLGMLETVYKVDSVYSNSFYIYVKPKDTVLIISNELIALPNNIMGYVTSRVSNVVNGFGHISTTVDPNWQGALLIALSNPSNHSLKVKVGITTKKDIHNQYSISDEQNALASLTLHYVCTHEYDLMSASVYKNMRVDLLESIKYDNKHGIKSYFRTKFHFKRRKFTEYFFDYIRANEKNMRTPEGWSDFLDEFSKVTPKLNTINEPRAIDFVITETRLQRIICFINEHNKAFTVGLITCIITGLFFLYKQNIIDFNIFSKIIEWILN